MSLRLIANWKLNGSKEFNQKWFRDFFKSYKVDDLSFLGIAPPSIYINHLIYRSDLLPLHNYKLKLFFSLQVIH